MKENKYRIKGIDLVLRDGYILPVVVQIKGPALERFLQVDAALLNMINVQIDIRKEDKRYILSFEGVERTYYYTPDLNDLIEFAQFAYSI